MLSSCVLAVAGCIGNLCVSGGVCAQAFWRTFGLSINKVVMPDSLTAYTSFYAQSVELINSVSWQVMPTLHRSRANSN
jgi:hypothetical protein